MLDDQGSEAAGSEGSSRIAGREAAASDGAEGARDRRRRLHAGLLEPPFADGEPGRHGEPRGGQAAK